MLSPKARLLIKQKDIKFKRIVPQKRPELQTIDDKFKIRSYIYYKDSEYEDLFINQCRQKEIYDDEYFDVSRYISESVMSLGRGKNKKVDYKSSKKLENDRQVMRITTSGFKEYYQQEDNQKIVYKPLPLCTSKLKSHSIKMNPNFRTSMGSFHKPNLNLKFRKHNLDPLSVNDHHSRNCLEPKSLNSTAIDWNQFKNVSRSTAVSPRLDSDLNLTPKLSNVNRPGFSSMNMN